MAARASVGRFNFASERGVHAPSVTESQIVRLSKICSFMCGSLAVLLVASVVMTIVAIRRADVIPFVADGGVFGCEVQTR